MKPLYDFKEISKPFFPTKEFPLKKEVDKIFSVPKNNCVGTNSLWNAIALLQFKKDKIKYDVLKKNFLTYVTGGSLYFMPVFSNDTIGYAQTRRFITFNIKNNKWQRHSVCNRLEERISIVDIIDWDKKLFLFNINYNSEYSRLRVMDLSKDEKKIVSEKRLKSAYSFYKDAVFLHSKNFISATDLNLKTKSHPVVDFIKTKLNRFNRISEIIFHPKLPFLILFDDDEELERNSWMIKWNLKNEFNLIKLFEKNDVIKCRFSPDNNWMIFKNASSNPDKYYIMRIDPSFPNYLSAPIPLGEAPNYPEDATAWTTNPLSFVVSKGDRLILYELEKFKNYNFKDLAK